MRQRNDERYSPPWWRLASLTFLFCLSGSQEYHRLQLEHQLQTAREAPTNDKKIRLAEEGARDSRSNPEWRAQFLLLEAEAELERTGPEKSLEILHRLPQTLPTPALNVKLGVREGWAESVAGRYPSAIAILDRTREYAAAKSPKDLPSVDIYRADVFVFMGNHKQARAINNAGLVSATAQNDTKMIRQALDGLGFSYQNESRYEEALFWYERQLGQIKRERVPDQSALAAVLFNLGACYYQIGDSENALEYYRQAEPMLRQQNNESDLDKCLENMGLAYLDLGDTGDADRYLSEALTRIRSRGDKLWLSRALHNLAGLYLRQGKLEQSAALNTEAESTAAKLNDARINSACARLEGDIARERGDYTTALNRYGLVINAKIADPAPALDARAGTALLYADLHQAQKADAAFQAALNSAEQSGGSIMADEYKISYFDSLINIYHDYIDFLMANGRVERALEVAEASRARLLAERLNRRAAQSTGVGYRDLARQSGAVLLSYWLGEKHSWLWVVTPRGVTSHELAPREELRHMVKSFDAFIQRPGNDPRRTKSDAGQQLSAALVKPAEAELRGATKVLIVPDDALHGLNMETLPAGNPEDPHFWLEDVTIANVPSLNLLQTSAPGKTRSLLLIGDTVSPGDEYPKLAHVADEMDQVEKSLALKPARERVIRGQEAVPASYELALPENFRYIHFSAHAVARRLKPLSSAVILSPATDRSQDNQAAGKEELNHSENYELSAREVLRHPLQAELVTLSACKSMGGRWFAGEGLVGFEWAFLSAGARNVVAGLWNVDDASAPKLMGAMYRELAAGKSPTDALHQAKLEMIRAGGTTAHPFYWGAFEVYTRSAWGGSRGSDRNRIALARN